MSLGDDFGDLEDDEQVEDMDLEESHPDDEGDKSDQDQSANGDQENEESGEEDKPADDDQTEEEKPVGGEKLRNELAHLPPPAAQRDPIQHFVLDHDIESKLALLSQMGGGFDYEKMLRIALEPMQIRNPTSWTMQLPAVMKNLMSNITKTVSLFYPTVSNAQVQRCMVIVLLQHLPELLILAREAESKAQEQP